jgi:glycosyltransferase involved in cell wall biosynthesis
LRIAFATHHFPPKYLGGVELITHRAAHWLTRSGHAVQVVCIESIDRPSRGLDVVVDEYEGITVHRLSFGRGQTGNLFRESFQNPLIEGWFDKFLRANTFDIVHIHSGYLLSGSVIEAVKRVGIPTVVSLHDYWFMCPRITLLRPDGLRCSGPRHPTTCAWCLRTEQRRYRFPDQASRGILGRLMQRALRSPRLAQMAGWHEWVAEVAERKRYLHDRLASVDMIITSARMSYDILLQDGLSPHRVRRIPYGLDLSGWQCLEPTPPENGHLRIGYLGNLIPAKGAHVLISAFRKLRASAVQPQLTLHGSTAVNPRYVQRLKKLAGSDSRITFAGRYENIEVERVLSKIDVLVVPSLWYEIGPLVVLEAMAAKTPVVVGNIPNMRYLIEDEMNGLHYAVDSAADLARQLQRVADQPGLLESLRRGIGPVRTIQEEMTELTQVYVQAIEGFGHD